MELKFSPTVLLPALATHSIILRNGDSSVSNALQMPNFVASSYHLSTTSNGVIQGEILRNNDHRSVNKSDSAFDSAADHDESPDVGLLASASSGNPFFSRYQRNNNSYNRRSIYNGNGDELRFLQTSTNSSTCPSTCNLDLCACVNEKRYPYLCVNELHAVCKTYMGIEGCVPPDSVYYFENVYCPFAQCIIDGISYEQCFCDFYQKACDLYSENPDKMASYCAVATCCRKQYTDERRAACWLTAGSVAPSGITNGPTVSPTDKPSEISTTKSMGVPSTAPSKNENEGEVSWFFLRLSHLAACCIWSRKYTTQNSNFSSIR